jgi:glycogen operon protein
MLLSGDEAGRTQGGNNNVYCQDNEISWFDWSSIDEDLLAFTTALIALRRAHPVFHRRRWFQGRPLRGTPDLLWLKPEGTTMTEADWNEGHQTCVGMFLNGDGIASPGPRGERVVDDSFLVLINASPDPRKWSVSGAWGERWHRILDTADGPADEGDDVVAGEVELVERSILVLRRLPDDAA